MSEAGNRILPQQTPKVFGETTEVRGAGADMSGLPSGVRGTPGVG